MPSDISEVNMAINLIQKIDKYIGTAAERAAMVTTTVTCGSTFEETDTGLLYKWSGSAWFKRIYPAA